MYELLTTTHVLIGIVGRSVEAWRRGFRYKGIDLFKALVFNFLIDREPCCFRRQKPTSEINSVGDGYVFPRKTLFIKQLFLKYITTGKNVSDK